MSKIVLYPANGFDFDAADVAAYLAGLTSGVFSSAEDFPVTAAGGLTVTVGAGRGWVHPSRFTGYSITKRESDTLTMPLADPSLPRIDRIIMRYDAGCQSRQPAGAAGYGIQHTYGPAILPQRTDLRPLPCRDHPPAGSTSITTGQITDTRLDEALCGIVRDSVTGIPTDELLAAAGSASTHWRRKLPAVPLPPRTARRQPRAARPSPPPARRTPRPVRPPPSGPCRTRKRSTSPPCRISHGPAPQP